MEVTGKIKGHKCFRAKNSSELSYIYRPETKCNAFF